MKSDDHVVFTPRQPVVGITIGLFLPRVMLGKYAGARGIPDLYHAMVIGDTLMTFALAMLLAACAAAFAGDSMYPRLIFAC